VDEQGDNLPAADAAPAGDMAKSDGRPKRRRRRRGRKPGGRPGGKPDGQPGRGGRPHRGGGGSEHHATTAIRALSALARGLLEVEGVDFLSQPRFMEIRVKVPLDLDRDAKGSAAGAVEQILTRVQEVREHDRALVPGAVYCYFSESAQAETSRPVEIRHVFDGYSSTGRPSFTDFVTMAIERKDPDIDALLAGDDVVLTHVTMGRVLRTAQLAEFGKSSPVYNILGQVDAGLFPLMGSNKKAAFSFQLLRGTTLEGKPRLRVHPVGAADVLDLADPQVATILGRFQRRLDEESLRLAGKQAGGEAVDEEEFVVPMLQELARQIRGRARRLGRRTRHADDRSAEGQRPTAKAWEDAEQADDEHIVMDDREGTVVVLGPKGRVHVFTPDARHVTSLVMQGAAIGKRRQAHRWRAAEPSERGEFRIQLRQRRPADEAAAQAAAAQPAPAPAPTPTSPAAAPTPPPAPSDAQVEQPGGGHEVDHGT
jgi:hypothetical protein